ncbi:MAG: biotin/lipoyl-binding protein, partial [Acidobacteriota bacterium]
MSIDRESIDELRIDRTRAQSRLPGWLAWVVLAVILAAAGFWWLKRPGLPVVTTAAVGESASGGSSAVLNASGYITARRAATVSSKVTGKVTEVLVEEGMTVAAGQLMATLDPAVADQSLQLSRAQAQA